MTIPVTTLDYTRTAAQSRPRLGILYFAEGMTELAAVMTTIGIYFYTQDRFGWQPQHNLLLAAGHGLVYIPGALCAKHLASRLGRRNALVLLSSALALLTLLALVFPTPPVVAGAVVAYGFFGAMWWPSLESLLCIGADAGSLSKRLGLFNLIWSGVAFIALAGSGAIIRYWPPGIFLVPMLLNGLSAVLLYASRVVSVESSAPCDAHAAPEPELLHMRTLALWLSRISLPASLLVMASLMAIMPSLPVMDGLDVTEKTIIGSVWMAVRWVGFVILGATVWWHTRPRMLLVAAVVMLLAFVAITIRLSDMGISTAWRTDLAIMLAGQAALGFVSAVIYMSSLYFGMVLSEGSTEHGGYHEALIGLGSVIGPGLAASLQWWRPNDLRVGVAAVSGLVVVSLAMSLLANARLGVRR